MRKKAAKRESYVKYTGEGISLDFRQYEVRLSDKEYPAPEIKGDLEGAEFLGTAEVLRDQQPQGCRILQWRYKECYVISVCGMM